MVILYGYMITSTCASQVDGLNCCRNCSELWTSELCMHHQIRVAVSHWMPATAYLCVVHPEPSGGHSRWIAKGTAFCCTMLHCWCSQMQRSCVKALFWQAVLWLSLWYMPSLNTCSWSQITRKVSAQQESDCNLQLCNADEKQYAVLKPNVLRLSWVGSVLHQVLSLHLDTCVTFDDLNGLQTIIFAEINLLTWPWLLRCEKGIGKQQLAVLWPELTNGQYATMFGAKLQGHKLQRSALMSTW